MPDPHWRFASMPQAAINENPVQGEFFTAASDLPERFVREAIQNSLDAKAGDAPVRVRFAFSTAPLPAGAAARYLIGIEPHLVEAVTVAVSSTAARTAAELLSDDMPYLAVEDFGTTGLTGDIEANGALEKGNHFWGFFRSVGISPKPDDKGGSWGLGKWVFPDASKLNIFIGLTRRAGDGGTLLMGQAMLKTHMVEKVKYPSYGSYAAHDNADDHQWLPRPEMGGDFVARAQRDFALQRGDQPGLSVIIPHPEDELTPDAISRAALTQYFLPIVKGDLIVEVVDSDGAQVIDSSTIDEALAKVAPGGIDEDERRDDETAESLRRAVDLARWALDQDSFITLPASVRRKIEMDSSLLGETRERYGQGERLAFELTNSVRSVDGESVDCTFRVFIEQAGDLEHGHDYYIRGHLRIPKMDYIKRYKARALVLVDGTSALGRLLRDAEGPAHAEWKLGARDDRLSQRWVGIGRYGRVDEVRQAAARLLKLLSETPKEQLKTLLAEIFPKDSPAEAAPTPTRNDTSSDEETDRTIVPPPLPPPPRSRDPILINNFEDGFSVHTNSALDAPLALAGSTYRLEFAYDVARGGQSTPFTRFKQGVKDGSPDFNLWGGSPQVAAKGCRWEPIAENEILVKVGSDNFHLRVTGFDGRDVVARFNPVSTAAESEDDD